MEKGAFGTKPRNISEMQQNITKVSVVWCQNL